MYREACAVDASGCLATVPACSLDTNATAVVDGVECQPTTFNQPCDWETQPEQLGKQARGPAPGGAVFDVVASSSSSTLPNLAGGRLASRAHR